MVNDPAIIGRDLGEALYEALSGRPGPVWIDIPTDVQRAQIEPAKLPCFLGCSAIDVSRDKENLNRTVMPQVISMIRAAKRPILIAGHGIRLAGAQSEFSRLINRLRIPVITTWNGIDLIDHDHPLYVGSAGVMGQRGANFAVANADLILSIGSRMDTRQVGNDPKTYAHAAKKIVVDINVHELEKGLIKIDLPIQSDAKVFIDILLSHLVGIPINIEDWRNSCHQWKLKYPVVLPEYRLLREKVNSYVFVESLCEQLTSDDTVITDMGTSFTCTMQTFKVKGSQRLFTNSGFASMGFGLPATIGAWFGSKNRDRIVGIYGDGGFQMNIQELQTIVHYQIPIKIFILNNGCYLTIKHTQERFFEGNLVGSTPESGYSAPNFAKLARAYRISSVTANRQNNLKEIIRGVLDSPGPELCEVMMPHDQELIPVSVLDKSRGHSGSPIERMYPFLTEEEFLANMIIDPV